jgi:hypothetical protein
MGNGGVQAERTLARRAPRANDGDGQPLDAAKHMVSSMLACVAARPQVPPSARDHAGSLEGDLLARALTVQLEA